MLIRTNKLAETTIHELSRHSIASERDRGEIRTLTGEAHENRLSHTALNEFDITQSLARADADHRLIGFDELLSGHADQTSGRHGRRGFSKDTPLRQQFLGGKRLVVIDRA